MKRMRSSKLKLLNKSNLSMIWTVIVRCLRLCGSLSSTHLTSNTCKQTAQWSTFHKTWGCVNFSSTPTGARHNKQSTGTSMTTTVKLTTWIRSRKWPKVPTARTQLFSQKCSTTSVEQSPFKLLLNKICLPLWAVHTTRTKNRLQDPCCNGWHNKRWHSGVGWKRRLMSITRCSKETVISDEIILSWRMLSGRESASNGSTTPLQRSMIAIESNRKLWDGRWWGKRT